MGIVPIAVLGGGGYIPRMRNKSVMRVGDQTFRINDLEDAICIVRNRGQYEKVCTNCPLRAVLGTLHSSESQLCVHQIPHEVSVKLTLP